MTSMRWRNIECPNCKHIFRVTTYPSINTWMDPEAIVELLAGKLHSYTCPQCQQAVYIISQILISCRRGGFNVSTGDSLEVIGQKLREFGVMDDAGHVIDSPQLPPAKPPKRLVPPPLSAAEMLATRKKNVQDLIIQLHAELQESEADGRFFELHYGPQIENIRLKLELAKGAIQLNPPAAALWGEIQAIKRRRGDPTSEPA